MCACALVRAYACIGYSDRRRDAVDELVGVRYLCNTTGVGRVDMVVLRRSVFKEISTIGYVSQAYDFHSTAVSASHFHTSYHRKYTIM